MHLNAEVDIFTLFHKEVFDSSNRQPYIWLPRYCRVLAHCVSVNIICQMKSSM
jgi:hypothetical protein